MNRSTKIGLLANTKWSTLSETAINEVLLIIQKSSRKYSNIKTFIEVDGKAQCVFYDFLVTITELELATEKDIKILKVFQPSNKGFIVLDNLSELNSKLLIYSALSQLRIL